eukprot:scaffold3763_cov103-Isochrysis_galbana.AAC.4
MGRLRRVLFWSRPPRPPAPFWATAGVWAAAPSGAGRHRPARAGHHRRLEQSWIRPREPERKSQAEREDCRQARPPPASAAPPPPCGPSCRGQRGRIAMPWTPNRRAPALPAAVAQSRSLPCQTRHCRPTPGLNPTGRRMHSELPRWPLAGRLHRRRRAVQPPTHPSHRLTPTPRSRAPCAACRRAPLPAGPPQPAPRPPPSPAAPPPQMQPPDPPAAAASSSAASAARRDPQQSSPRGHLQSSPPCGSFCFDV